MLIINKLPQTGAPPVAPQQNGSPIIIHSHIIIIIVHIVSFQPHHRLLGMRNVSTSRRSLKDSLEGRNKAKEKQVGPPLLLHHLLRPLLFSFLWHLIHNS
ncbi:GL20439 [Drosophila persimilis]|uniref:GL20439 n=1 Tax=Drosophila persimilis TaxID=7234 RepID=B4IRV3_DROPE|nr:GL22933 [Drosophila persimilis]EDW39420.1 GL20439 [Drosophila persimilis]